MSRERFPHFRSPEIAYALRMAISQGCTWERNGDGHVNVWDPTHTRRVTISTTATGQARSIQNARAAIRRVAGGTR